jgi:hypothetical protein
MPRTTSRSEVGAIAGVALVALIAASALSYAFSDHPSVERIWPLVVAAVDYLAGFAVAAALRVAATPLRPTSIRGLALPAVGYGLAIFAATWLPDAVAAQHAETPWVRVVATIASAAFSALIAASAWRSDLRIDPYAAQETAQSSGEQP